MRRFLYLTLMLVTLGAQVSPALAANDRLKMENNLLRAEYDQAHKKQIYLFLNVTAKTFEIRSSGITIAAIPIQEIRPWGPMPEAGMHLVAEKDRVPDREKIKIPPPGGEEPAVKPTPVPSLTDPAAKPAEKKYEVQATEVTDMPTNYSLWLEGGGLIVIKSFSPGADWKSSLLQRFEKPIWRISHALKSDLNRFHKKDYTDLTLVMTPRDAQRLYWAVPIETAILIPMVD